MTSAPLTGTIRVGIVGAGLVSDLHIRGLRRLEGVEIAGICDADAARAERKAAQHGIPAWFGSQRELLAAARPHVVHLLTPPWTHADLCLEAFEAGAHAYVEKPLAVSVADCERMRDGAERSGRRLCVGHCMVYDPLMQRARDLLASGDVGEVLHAAALYAFDPGRIAGYDQRWYRRLPGGGVEDLASHPASLLLRVLGTPTSVTGARGRGARGGDEVAALVDAARGTGSLVVSLGMRPEEVSLDIRCTRGLIRINFSTMVMSVQRERGIPKKLAHGVRNLETASQLVTQTFTSTARFLAKRMDTTKGIHSLIEAFYGALRAGEPAPVGVDEGLEAVRLMRTLWPESDAPARPARWTLAEPTPPASPRSEPPRSALVTGATGFIGSHLVRLLAERGVRVRALARNPERAAALVMPGVEVVIGDFGEPAVTDGLADGMDTIFHLASVMKGSWDDFERVDVNGTRRLLEEAVRAGVRRIVYTSTLAAYPLGDLPDGAVVTEDSVPPADSSRVSPYARAKLAVEEMLLEAHRAGRIEAVITRPGLVFGPGSTPFLTHVPHLGSLRGDRYVLFGDGRTPLPLTYVGNTVEALWRCATVPEAAGETFTLVDPRVPTQRSYVRALARASGRPLRVTGIPRPAATLLGLGVETAARVMKRDAPTSRRLLRGKWVRVSFDCSRAERILGWNPEVSWEEGLQRAVEGWRAQRAGGAPGRS